MPQYLGIDTSNYTTSVAVYNSDTGEIRQEKQLLPVTQGQLGLRQSDAVFLHVRQLGQLMESLLQDLPIITAVGVSLTPRDEEGSYMPCFLSGDMAARSLAAGLHIPRYGFSHQAGHIMAALFATHRLDLVDKSFLAFHISGGTTQCLLVEPDKQKVFRIATISETLDLNAGQVVDRVGKMLNLGFPAGPKLEQLASHSQKEYNPSPTLKDKDCCLSGVENQCAKMLEQGGKPEDVAYYCLCMLGATILEMTRRVKTRYPAMPLVYAGGVMSNKQIRAKVLEQFEAEFAPPAFSSDNAAGIAVLAALRHQQKIPG